MQSSEIEGPSKRPRLDGVLHIRPEYRIESEPTTIEGEVKHKRKERGQNKAKERKPNVISNEINLCFAAASGNQCSNQNCRKEHDIEKYLETKEPDLGDSCPTFNLYGECKYGIKCRFLGAHSKSASLPKTSDGEFIQNNISLENIKRVRTNNLVSQKCESFLAFWKENEKDCTGQEDLIDRIKKKEQIDPDFKLNPREVKKFSFKGKTYLAPLTTVGNIPFRRICKGFGVDITCSEMVLAQNLLSGQMSEWALLKRHPSEDLFGIQITGNKPESFIKACDALNELCGFDFLDINLGCPVEAICCKGNGSALMEKRTKLAWMVKGAQSVLDRPVTIKLRTAIMDKKPLAHKLIPIFQSWDIAAATLHGRSKEQRYTKSADWDYIQECGKGLVDKNSFEFIGNGDVFNPSDYWDKLNSESSVDGVMIGRGALIKPWIFKEIKERKLWDISSNERLDILKDYAKFGMEHWGTDTRGLNLTRKFLCEQLSFFHRYVPIGLIEVLPQKMNLRPEKFCGRNELETLMASSNVSDWIKLTELVLGPTPSSFSFIPKYYFCNSGINPIHLIQKMPRAKI
jgi:tRNA-dihydrouridine synthase 3